MTHPLGHGRGHQVGLETTPHDRVGHVANERFTANQGLSLTE